MPNVTCIPFYFLVTTGYLVDTSGYLVVTSGYLIATTGYFCLLLVTSRYFSLLLVPRFSNNDDYDNICEDLQKKSGWPNMNLRKQRTLCIEIYKTLNKISLGYINDIFNSRNTDKLTREK